MNHNPVFPLELLEAIVHASHLHNDIPALRTWSLVSRDLLPLSRTYLFSTITIVGVQSAPGLSFGPNRNIRHAPFLYSRGPLCVCDSPHLSPYVRRLHIYNAGVKFPVIHYIRLDHDLFVRVLGSLSQLRVVTMSSFGHGEQWTQLPEQIRAAFANTFALPTLTRLSLTTGIATHPIFFALPSLRGMQHLQVLSISKEISPVSSVVETSQVEVSQQMRLRSLDISFVPVEIFSFLLKAIDFTQLTHMSIRGFMDRTERFSEWKMLARVPFLTHLKIYAWRNPKEPTTVAPVVLNFRQLERLRSLYIVVTFDVSVPARPPPPHVAVRIKAFRNPLPWLVQVLSMLGTSNKMLENVNIVLDVESVPELPKMELAEWGQLDVLLSSLQVPYLTIQASDPAATETFPPFARDLLPAVWEKRGFHLRFQSLDHEMLDFLAWHRR